MQVSAKVLLRFMGTSEYVSLVSADAQAVYLARKLDELALQSNKLREVDRLEHEEEKRHEKAVRELKEQRRALQAACPHIDVRYIPDASGNNDSEEHCNQCGLNAKRIERKAVAV